jgi:hypothetical protein
MDKRMCLMCKHFDIELDTEGYASTGYFAVAEVTCSKNHFTKEDASEYEVTKSLRRVNSKAENCPDFVLAES